MPTRYRTRSLAPAVAAWAAVCWLLAPGAQADPPFTVGGDPRVDPDDFRVTVFASGLDFPFGMQRLSDGSLLVAISTPDSPGSFFESTGKLLRLVDADGDGVADDAGALLYSGLPGGLVALRMAGELAFVASGANPDQRISILRQGATPADPFALIGSIDFAYLLPWQHPNSTLAVREAPGQPGLFELFFQVGSRDNALATTDTVALSGLLTASVNGDAIYKLTVDDTGASLVLSGLTEIATGLRNPFGIAFHPATGDLYFEDNGIDPESGQTQSADELNLLAAAAIGGAVEDYGFPDHFIEYRTGVEIGSGGIAPITTFQPIPPPNGSESEGPAEIAFAPPLFPPGLDDGIFVGFHGKFSNAGVSNEENPLVYVDLGTGEYFHFISNAEPGIGHLDSLLATSDSLFAADMINVNGLSAAGAGVIYQIQSRPVATPGLPAGGLALLAALLGGLGARTARNQGFFRSKRRVT